MAVADRTRAVDDAAPPGKLPLRAGFEAARSFPLAADVVPCRRSWFEARRSVVNSLAWMAATRGQLVDVRRADEAGP